MGLLDDPSVIIAAASLGVSILVLLVMRSQSRVMREQYKKQFPTGVAADVDRLKLQVEQVRQDMEVLGEKVDSDIQEAAVVAVELKSVKAALDANVSNVKEALENNAKSMDRLADSVDHKFEALSGRIDKIFERLPRNEPGDHD